VDSDNMLAYFSSFGSEVDVVAPGVNIYSTYKGEDYKSSNGTSMATPHIAGLAALFVQENRDRGVEVDLEDFRDALIQGSFDLGDSGYDIYYGYGLPQAQSVIFGEALE
jgi:subtilisin family serine protease